MLVKIPTDQGDLKEELSDMTKTIKTALDECGRCQGRATFLGWSSEQKLDLFSDCCLLCGGSFSRTGVRDVISRAERKNLSETMK